MFAISIAIPPIAIAWAGLSLLIGLLALTKRRSFVAWMWASILFTPFAVVVLFYLPPAEKSGARKDKPQAVPPALPSAPSLARRAISGAVSWVKRRRTVSALSNEGDMVHRALEGHANHTELDRDIARSVQNTFGRL